MKVGVLGTGEVCQALAMAWIITGIRNNAWSVAYKMVS